MTCSRHALAGLLLVTAIILFCAACSGRPEDDCPLTIDAVEVIDEQVYEGKTYYLVGRVSGWHDKTAVIQLFDEKPKLDKCRLDLIPPLIEDSIDPSLQVVDFEIDLEERVFRVSYAENDNADRLGALKIRFKGAD